VTTALANPCDEWTGLRDEQGYGRVYVSGRGAVRAHRLAWETAYGPIPDGLCVLHTCDNPPCRNVEHLFLGTRTDNAADRESKGRNGNAAKTHCPHGHPYSEENTYINTSGGRCCRTCKREANRLAKRIRPGCGGD
jgi:hypothetical protein